MEISSEYAPWVTGTLQFVLLHVGLLFVGYESRHILVESTMFDVDL